MNRKQAITLIRRLLKRTENEEYEISQEFGYASIPSDHINKYILANLDTVTIKFLGPKTKTKIPPVLIVWPNGTTEERSYQNLRGLIKQNMRPTYLYCPINPNTIYPESHRQKVLSQLRKNNVCYIKEN